MRVVEILKSAGKALKRELRVYRQVLRDPRTPFAARVLLGLAIAYLLLPFDLIPDFLPVIGHLDDVIIVPALFLLAIKMIPRQVIVECREQATLKTTQPRMDTNS